MGAATCDFFDVIAEVTLERTPAIPIPAYIDTQVGPHRQTFCCRDLGAVCERGDFIEFKGQTIPGPDRPECSVLLRKSDILFICFSRPEDM